MINKNMKNKKTIKESIDQLVKREGNSKIMTQEEYLSIFKSILDKMYETTKRKNSDYAGKGDAFANFKMIEYLTQGRVSTLMGIFTRKTDKLQRAINLESKDPDVVEESQADTLLDDAVYSIIAYIYIKYVKNK